MKDLTQNLGFVGIGDPELWSLVEENLEMLRQDLFVQLELLNILKVMLRMGKGTGYYWRRLAESLPTSFVNQLKAEALRIEEKTIGNYLKEGFGKRKTSEM